MSAPQNTNPTQATSSPAKPEDAHRRSLGRAIPLASAPATQETSVSHNVDPMTSWASNKWKREIEKLNSNHRSRGTAPPPAQTQASTAGPEAAGYLRTILDRVLAESEDLGHRVPQETRDLIAEMKAKVERIEAEERAAFWGGFREGQEYEIARQKAEDEKTLADKTRAVDVEALRLWAEHEKDIDDEQTHDLDECDCDDKALVQDQAQDEAQIKDGATGKDPKN